MDILSGVKSEFIFGTKLPEEPEFCGVDNDWGPISHSGLYCAPPK
jgi:hypothetical protein